MKIYIVKDNLSGCMWAYTSITAACLHFENPLDIKPRRWHQLAQEKGYPFDHSGCTVSLLKALTTAGVREDNPA